MYSPPAIEMEPATTAATPAITIVAEVTPGDAATPRIRPEVDMIPSLAPSTPALSQLSFAAIELRWNSTEASVASRVESLGLRIFTRKHYFCVFI